MTQLQEYVLTVLGGVGRVALTENAIADRMQESWPTERGYAVSAISIALKQLEAAAKVHRSVSGRWTKLLERREGAASTAAAAGAGAPSAPEEPTTIRTEGIEVTKTESKTCPRCKASKAADDFVSNGYCKTCSREMGKERYAQKKAAAGGGATKSAPNPRTKHHIGKGGRRKKNGNGSVPLQLSQDRMVIMQFAIRIEDSAGATHDLFLTGDTVKRLAQELQEYL